MEGRAHAHLVGYMCPFKFLLGRLRQAQHFPMFSPPTPPQPRLSSNCSLRKKGTLWGGPSPPLLQGLPERFDFIEGSPARWGMACEDRVLVQKFCRHASYRHAGGPFPGLGAGNRLSGVPRTQRALGNHQANGG